MSGLSGIDPRVEEILREVARDPRSSLLRVERPRVARELFERSPRVSLGATGLSAAERELLRAHRAEAAWLLKEICKERLANEERSKLFLSRYIDAEREVEILEPAEQRRRADELRTLDLPLVQDPLAGLDVFGLLERATAGPAETRPSIAQLALASLRLEPEDSTRICLGLELVFASQPRAAIEVYSRVIAARPEPLLASVAIANAAFAHYRLGNLARSLELHEQAVAIGGPRGPSVWPLLMMAVRLGDSAGARRAMGMLADESGHKARWLRDEVRSLLGRVKRGEGDPLETALRAARELVPAVESAARKVCDGQP